MSLRSLLVVLCAAGVIPVKSFGDERATSAHGKAQQARVAVSISDCPTGSRIAETENFRIRWRTSDKQLREFATACETLRSQIIAAWLPESEDQSWSPRCEIVVHADVTSYVRTLGRGSEQTSGCATLTLDQGRVVVRRIDVRADAVDWRTESLPHELTHVILADRFNQRRIPSWADEGIAMLAESPEKLERRMDALHVAIRAGRASKVSTLLRENAMSARVDRSAFYGQSVALVAHLLDRGTPEQLLQFVEAGQTVGYNAALRDVYGIADWTELEPGWLASATPARLARVARHRVAYPSNEIRLTSATDP